MSEILNKFCINFENYTCSLMMLKYRKCIAVCNLHIAIKALGTYGPLLIDWYLDEMSSRKLEKRSDQNIGVWKILCFSNGFVQFDKTMTVSFFKCR